MASSTLQATSPLTGTSESYTHHIGGVSLQEVTGRALVSVAVPLGAETALATAVSTHFSCDLPAIGKSVMANAHASRWLGLQSDQYWLQFDEPVAGESPDSVVRNLLDDAAYCTDQSDSWLSLDIQGTGVNRALERICPLDIDQQVFEAGGVARTSMEHVSVVLVRLAEDHWLLLSPRSTAETFLHAVEVSIKWVA